MDKAATHSQVNWLKWTLIFAVVTWIGTIVYFEGQHNEQIQVASERIIHVEATVKAAHDDNAAAIQRMSDSLTDAIKQNHDDDARAISDVSSRLTDLTNVVISIKRGGGFQPQK